MDYIMYERKIVDASFTTAPRQRNTRDENKAIKEDHGKGYKNHTKVDAKSKLIDGYAVTDASVHNSQALGDLISEQDAGQANMPTEPMPASNLME